MSIGLQFLFDENVHGDIIDGFLQRNAAIDAVRAHDVGLRGADDAFLLDWAIVRSGSRTPHRKRGRDPRSVRVPVSSPTKATLMSISRSAIGVATSTAQPLSVCTSSNFSFGDETLNEILERNSVVRNGSRV